MIFHAFQREDDDAIFTVARNVRGSGTAFAIGDACQWSTSSPDGVRITAPTSAQLNLFRGIVAEAIADSAYGKVQVGGYCATAHLAAVTVTSAAGVTLVPVAGSVNLAVSTGSALGDAGFVYLAEAVVTNTAVQTIKTFIRAL
jgi:hypothetical protein